MTDIDPLHLSGGRVLYGPGLLRKPRIGETLISRRTGERMLAERFDANENILHTRYADGRPGAFIWRFHDGLNRLVRHDGEEYDTP